MLSLVWWLVNTTEGVYLGRRAVIWLYDRYAKRYDDAKNRSAIHEYAFLSQPLLHFHGDPAPHVLDVATGTGRLPRALFAHKQFTGSVVGLDLSQSMLEVAAAHLQEPLQAGHLSLLQADATSLHFSDNSFDIVTCLETLEFLPDAAQTLAEIVRVTRPGGLIGLTNRHSTDTWLFPGRTLSNAAFEQLLVAKHGLTVINFNAEWSDLYALVWLRKVGTSRRIGPTLLEDCWQCSKCGHMALYRAGPCWHCGQCAATYAHHETDIIKIGD